MGMGVIQTYIGNKIISKPHFISRDLLTPLMESKYFLSQEIKKNLTITGWFFWKKCVTVTQHSCQPQAMDPLMTKCTDQKNAYQECIWYKTCLCRIHSHLLSTYTTPSELESVRIYLLLMMCQAAGWRWCLPVGAKAFFYILPCFCSLFVTVCVCILRILKSLQQPSILRRFLVPPYKDCMGLGPVLNQIDCTRNLYIDRGTMNLLKMLGCWRDLRCKHIINRKTRKNAFAPACLNDS